MNARSRRGFGARLVALVAAAGLLMSVSPIDASPASAESSSGKNSAGGSAFWGLNFDVEVLSSPPDLISGGTARVRVELPWFVSSRRVVVELDGVDITDSFERERQHWSSWNPRSWNRSLQGVVADLPVGESELEVSFRGWFGRSLIPTETVTLTNHPSSGPMFSGPQQEPFLCSDDGDRADAELGPALDDDCATDTVVSFVYMNTAGSVAAYDPDAPRPDDMATTTTMDGKTVDYIVRWERGTINRFIYSIAVLSPDSQDVDGPDLSAWNDRLIYYFQGGVGIGHYQGGPSRSRMLYDDGLSAGYAIAYSTGTKTGEHYNLELGGETAIMVKDRFVTEYGDPDYTVGVGGSGGGIQQYVYAQNHEGLIDAGVPQYSYPDMITQTIHVGDCELLERWIDTELLAGETKWADWNNREWIEGMNASNEVSNPYQAVEPFLPDGSSECVNAWRGLSPLTLNPNYGTAPGVTPEQQAAVDWTHFDDLINIYGTADDGYAASTWDNVGVQYGLQALTDGNITVEEFLDLNTKAGSWKNEPDMVQEGCPFFRALCPTEPPTGAPIPDPYPNQVDPWSWRNQTHVPGSDAIAPRKTADPGAIEAAFDSGMVNRGDVQIPMIDWRNYLERELDMHNSLQSFATRQRLLNFDGDSSNQVIWFTDVEFEGPRFDQTPMALEVIDDWMRNIERRPWRSIDRNKPAAAVDSCFDAAGELIHAGADAWNGILDSNTAGPCTKQVPVYETSRIVAGAPITGDVFKCELRTVDAAIADGVYGGIDFDDAERDELDEIFADGVCDYDSTA
ncbi:MAG: DUF6351 family protein [Ilumatobacter sp.]|uniref:DUF6351 family protein n=1 Tax=Ilumatobacter sp. TaxID=1967498 RepID=UPI003C71B603